MSISPVGMSSRIDYNVSARRLDKVAVPVDQGKNQQLESRCPSWVWDYLYKIYGRDYLMKKYDHFYIPPCEFKGTAFGDPAILGGSYELTDNSNSLSGEKVLTVGEMVAFGQATQQMADFTLASDIQGMAVGETVEFSGAAQRIANFNTAADFQGRTVEFQGASEDIANLNLASRVGDSATYSMVQGQADNANLTVVDRDTVAENQFTSMAARMYREAALGTLAQANKPAGNILNLLV